MGRSGYTHRPVDLDVTSKDWLARLVDEELARYDEAAARARLPAELHPGAPGTDLEPGARLLVARSLRHRGLAAGAPPSPTEAFLEAVRGHVGLVLDLALLAGEPFHPPRRRASVGAALAAALGEPGMAVDADPAQPEPASPFFVDWALQAAGRALVQRFHPPGDPVHGLPLYPGALAVLRRHLARVTMGALRTGRLDGAALGRHRAFAQRELLLLVEAVSGLVAASAPQAGPEVAAVRARQVLRLGISRTAAREALRAMEAPRPPEALGAATPERVRPVLLEQLFLAQLRARLDAGRSGAWLEAFAAGAGCDANALVAARVEAAAQHDDLLAWFEAVEVGGGQDWDAISSQWEATADLMVERVTSVVTENLEALVTEIRETGELGQLLAKATAGKTLTADERRKVKAQLIDLAKAVPALAIFAAPGGMLLLPLLAKLLPFNVLPSSWDRSPRGPSAPRALPPARSPGGTAPAAPDGPPPEADPVKR